MAKIKIDWSKYTEPEKKAIYDAAVTMAAYHLEPARDVDRMSWNTYFIEKAAVMWDTMQAMSKQQ